MMPTEMSTEEFNSRLSLNVEEFLKRVVELTDEYCIKNDFKAGDRLLVLLYSCISVTRELNTGVWAIGEDYMKDVISKLKELKSDAD